jgi:fused signal recognition particle receptor
VALRKVRRVADKARSGEGNVHVLLVLDATTGQNGLAQAREFVKAVGVDALVLTKLDGTAKGGIVLAISRELDVPIAYVGTGEGLADLAEFDPIAFADALLG